MTMKMYQNALIGPFWGYKSCPEYFFGHFGAFLYPKTAQLTILTNVNMKNMNINIIFAYKTTLGSLQHIFGPGDDTIIDYTSFWIFDLLSA